MSKREGISLATLASRPAVRWGWLAFPIAAVFAAAVVLIQSQPKAQPAGSDEAAVLAADNALADAARAGDRTLVRRLLALQFNLVDVDGRTHPRKDFLGSLKEVAAAPSGDAKVRGYGSLAIVTGHRKSTHDTDVFFLDVWAKQRGSWRALLIQDVPIGGPEKPAASAVPAEPQNTECKNPCQMLPYRVRSPAEQELVGTFQAIEKAVVAHDAVEWEKHVADEFVRYTSGEEPATRSDRIAAIERQKQAGAAVVVGEVQTVRVAVYGDGALMTATQAAPDNSRPPYRAARVWARRNGQWQMTISVRTAIKQ